MKWVTTLTFLLALGASHAEWSDAGAQLREAVAKGKALDAEKLLAQGVDPDSVDPDRLETDATPLWLAVSKGDSVMTQLLLQFNGDVRAVEPKSGSTMLQKATADGLSQIVKILFAYGAKPDAADHKGITPRKSVGANNDMKALYKVYDAEGPAGFEDPPGTWALFQDEDKDEKPFYYNQATQEARWFRPPSCAWHKLTVDGQPVYMNAITKQTVWSKPAALSWTKMEVAGLGEFWINWKTNTTSKATPAELPSDLVDQIAEHHSKYWFNEVTGEARWDDPKEEQWNELRDEEGRRYWFRPSTEESTYRQPEDTAWREMESKEHKRPFFYNEVSQEIQWEMPAILGWTQHTEL